MYVVASLIFINYFVQHHLQPVFYLFCNVPVLYKIVALSIRKKMIDNAECHATCHSRRG